MFIQDLVTLQTRLTSTFWGTTRNYCTILIHFILLFGTDQSFALTTETLPSNIYSPAVRIGQISALDERYSESGTLVHLRDYKSIEFDADTLAKFNAKADELISTLNKFGLYKAGDLFNLGTLEIDTKPEINYIAPILAKGISETWTVGIGLPVITYSNTISLSQKFSNIEYYNQFRGLSPELDQALDTDLASETQQALENKGYQRLQSQKKQFLGDVQLMSLKKILQRMESKLLHILSVNLPTGPTYDSDNLLALNSFHDFSVENKFIYVKNIFYFLDLAPSISMKYVLPQKINARIPKNKDDVLPDQNSKDDVTKTAGLAFEGGLSGSVLISDQLKIDAGYALGQKMKDSYSSSDKGDSSVLADKSNSSWQKVSAEVSYSTVKNYLKTKTFIPMILSLTVYDTIAGENIERRLGQELNMTLFF